MRCVKCEQEHENLLSKSHDTSQLLVHDDSITIQRSMTIVYFILHMMVYRVIIKKVLRVVKIAKNLIMWDSAKRYSAKWSEPFTTLHRAKPNSLK